MWVRILIRGNESVKTYLFLCRYLPPYRNGPQGLIILFYHFVGTSLVFVDLHVSVSVGYVSAVKLKSYVSSIAIHPTPCNNKKKPLT
jgi:hypothetical protein